MILNVDLTELKLVAAKMQGLNSYLSALRSAGKSYSQGLECAKDFATHCGGEVLPIDVNGVSVIRALGEEAHCFQPYSDIDKFYFEI